MEINKRAKERKEEGKERSRGKKRENEVGHKLLKTPTTFSSALQEPISKSLIINTIVSMTEQAEVRVSLSCNNIHL